MGLHDVVEQDMDSGVVAFRHDRAEGPDVGLHHAEPRLRRSVGPGSTLPDHVGPVDGVHVVVVHAADAVRKNRVNEVVR